MFYINVSTNKFSDRRNNIIKNLNLLMYKTCMLTINKPSTWFH